ncbi:type II toxin-antitoxin system RelE/ParE family toxin [Halalkalicoccus sp. NIPERK01]|uniref:type II toxin-antitoxin system RelE family toxin n=1 Tax=Halalkalicoccus sp. NIPERK01 TaxID=3053469 RepID=UPI00256EA1FA|nr:hypothetical protein [Halalkalicoccus sp. NIPERK01]MDL5360869.1 hypothetical protein [Halalkalicoccus sp. NIPERK01]
MSDGDWTWELSSKAQDDLFALNSHEQERILDELDEIVDSPWRDPPDYGEPLQNKRLPTVSRIGRRRGFRTRPPSPGAGDLSVPNPSIGT